VLVENFRPGVLARIGFDPSRLAALTRAPWLTGSAGSAT